MGLFHLYDGTFHIIKKNEINFLLIHNISHLNTIRMFVLFNIFIIINNLAKILIFLRNLGKN
jgi:hypothetical protein